MRRRRPEDVLLPPHVRSAAANCAVAAPPARSAITARKNSLICLPEFVRMRKARFRLGNFGVSAAGRSADGALEDGYRRAGDGITVQGSQLAQTLWSVRRVGTVQSAPR